MRHFKRGVLLTLIGGTCWGFSGASGQFLFSHYQANPMWLTSMRMCFAGLLITLFGVLTQKEAMKHLVSQKKDLLKTFGFGFVLMLCQFTYLQAINTSNAGTATVLQYLSPVYIMVFICLTSNGSASPGCFLLSSSSIFLYISSALSELKSKIGQLSLMKSKYLITSWSNTAMFPDT